jgi:hypothetical protein
VIQIILLSIMLAAALSIGALVIVANRYLNRIARRLTNLKASVDSMAAHLEVMSSVLSKLAEHLPKLSDSSFAKSQVVYLSRLESAVKKFTDLSFGIRPQERSAMEEIEERQRIDEYMQSGMNRNEAEQLARSHGALENFKIEG